MSDQQGNAAPVPKFASAAEGTGGTGQVELPGARLAAQRQAKGWSVEHAASQLKFATRQVIALEADNYAALPGPVIVRGFVRTYARLLGLNPDALVALLPQEGSARKESIVPKRTLSTPFSESPLPLGKRRRISPGWIVGGVSMLLLIGAAVTIHEADWLSEMPQLAWLKSGSDQADAAEEPPAPALAAAQDLPPEVQDGSDKKIEPVEAGATNPALTNAPGPSINDGKNLLRLTFREDSWVEIRRDDKTAMVARVLKAGTTESFDITEPVTLVIGNAAGVDASLRDVDLDLWTANKNNVVRMSLK